MEAVKINWKEIGLPDLLFSPERLEEEFNDPRRAFRLVRTTDECRNAAQILTKKSACEFDPSWIEALIIALHRCDFRACDTVAEWYVTWPGLPDHARVRAFRFLLDVTLDQTEPRGSISTPYMPFLWGWSCNVINEALRRFPWLYWYHERYHGGLSQALSQFIDHQGEPYTDSELNRIERAVRRIVQAEDWIHIPSLAKFLELERAQRMQRKEGNDWASFWSKGSDWVQPWHIRGCFEGALEILSACQLQDEGQDVKRFLKEYGAMVRKELGLTNDPLVELSPRVIPIASPTQLSIKVTSNDERDRDLLAKKNWWGVPPTLYAEMTAEGGLFLPPYGRSPCRSMSVVSSSETPLECVFPFSPVGGRYRFKLILSFSGRRMGTSFRMDSETA